MLRSHVAFAGLALLLLTGGGGALAQAPAKPQPAVAATATSSGPTKLRIMVVDIQALLQNSKAAQMVRKQIEQKRDEYTKEIAHQEQVLRAERDALQREQSKLSAAALNARGRAFQQKVNALDRNVQAKREALEKSNAEALTKIQSAMLKIIADIAKQRNANLVFQRSELVLFDKHFDVTDQVLQKLNQTLPSLTVNFVTPTPAPAPRTVAREVPRPRPAPIRKR